MRIFKLTLATALLTLLTACAKPVPPEKSAYVGQWQATGMEILITHDGSVAYKRFEGGVNKSLDGPMKDFEGDNFVVGVGPLSTTFVVTAPPHQNGSHWKMTVDGVELTRK